MINTNEDRLLRIIKNVKCSSIDNGYKIPNIIHFTFSNTILPIEILKVIEHNKRVCNDCKFIFYNDNDIDKFIKENFNDEVYDCFKKINPIYGAMKADFFRYCVLYAIGGIYIDIKSLINYPIFKIINKNDLCLLDIPRNNLEVWRNNKPTYEQWLLIFTPRHPYLYTMIKQMVYYIKTNYIPDKINNISLSTKGKILNITGPDAFTKAILIYLNANNNNILHRNIDYNKYFDLNYKINYKKMYKINNKKHYSEYNEPLYITSL